MLALTADFGGTRIKIGLVRDHEIVVQEVVDASSRGGLAPRLPEIAERMKALCLRGGVGLDQCAGVGMALPCLIDPKTQSICSAIDKYPDATNLDLRGWARETLDLRLLLENDANAALAGEWQRGAGRGFRSVVLMTLGTGVGTSAVIDGVPLRGQHGQAGCLGGHMTVEVDGPECVCGNIGCVETQASTWALPLLAQAEPDFATSKLSGEAVVDYQSVFRLAEAGDAVATRLRDRAIRVWAATAVNLVHAYDPEVIVLGGGIMRTPEPTRSQIQRYIDQHAWIGWSPTSASSTAHVKGQVEVRVAKLPDTAALLGLHYLLERSLAG